MAEVIKKMWIGIKDTNINFIEQIDTTTEAVYYRDCTLANFKFIRFFSCILGLYCDNSIIYSLTGFEDSNIQCLSFTNCSLTSLSSLHAINCIYLDVSFNPNINLEGLFNTPNIQTFNCSNIGATDETMQSLSYLCNLNELICSYNRYQTLYWMTHAKNLTILDISNSDIKDLYGLRHAKLLTEINISNTNTNTFNLSELQHCNILKINCSNNPINSLHWLYYVPQLQELICENIGLKSSNGLNYVPYLIKLNVVDNQLDHLDIKYLIYLIELQCSSNLLTYLDVSHNINLKFLECDLNQIYKITGLAKLSKLIIFNCLHNFITEIDEIKYCLNIECICCGFNPLVRLPDTSRLFKLYQYHSNYNATSMIWFDNAAQSACAAQDAHAAQAAHATQAADLCSICLTKFDDNIVITPCKHIFHRKCLWSWIYNMNNCPFCRQMF